MKRNALLVGVNIYQYASKLNGCANDVDQLGKLLDRHEDHDDNFDVQKLVGNTHEHKVTKKLVLDLCKKLFKEKCDTVLFYFSGHGYADENGGYIATAETSKTNLGISMNLLLEMANDSPASNKIIILDCCHSGAIAQNETTDSLVRLADGVTIITASRHDQYSMERGSQGVFTQLIIEALKTGTGDLLGRVTPASVYNYIDQSLSWNEQRPLFKTNISQSVSLRQLSPPIEIESLLKIPELFSYPDSHFDLNIEFEPDVSIPDPNHKWSKEKAKQYRILQKMNRVNLVVPFKEEHMYWAAVKGTGCRLSPLGQHFWKLAKLGRL